jgi:hypothetical protein
VAVVVAAVLLPELVLTAWWLMGLAIAARTVWLVYWEFEQLKRRRGW